jgi:hypothetical protein
MPTLEELVEDHWRRRERNGTVERHWRYPKEERRYQGDIMPSLSAYAEKASEFLTLLLRNCERYELDDLETGMWRDIADGEHFRDVLYTSFDLAMDARLSALPAYSQTLRFFGDLRVYHDHGVFYLRGPKGVCAIPDSELSDETSAEITWRTGSANLPLAGQWLTHRAALQSPRPPCTDSPAYDIFISHKSKDFEYAKTLYDFLVAHGLSVFLSEVCLPKLGSADYMKRIDEALDRCRHMVLIATTVEHILSSWVEAEWRVFINEKRGGRKAGNFVTVVVGITDFSTLPISLRYYQVIPYAPDKLSELLPYVQTDVA